jgi:hypothetical protein
VAGIYYRHGEGGASLKDAASGILMLRQPGMETRCPAGAGQRQRSWLGAKHDSPGSRQKSPGLIFIILYTMNKYQKRQTE